jgi:hypothetical protein
LGPRLCWAAISINAARQMQVAHLRIVISGILPAVLISRISGYRTGIQTVISDFPRLPQA